jgi:hypothetical protein
MPHLAFGLYLMIFGYFAAAPLLGTVSDEDPLSTASLTRQSRFVKAAVARVLDDRPRRGRGAAPARVRRSR